MFVKSETLELRGYDTRAGKNGNYVVINTEEESGNPWQFYCPDNNVTRFPKGSKVTVIFEVKRYQNKDSLIVHKIEKVN